MTRLIDADELKKEIEGLVVGGAEGLKNYYENGSKSDENSWIGGVYDAYELIDNAPTVELFCSYLSDGEVKQPCVEAPCSHERPQGKCKNCKSYRQYGLRVDGYCEIPRMTSEGEQYINVTENFYCSYFEEADNEMR